MHLADGLLSRRETFNQAFLNHIKQTYTEDSRLHKACRYALEGEGKRIRPLLALLIAELVGGSKTSGLSAAIAVEMIHTYSLVHDDLPAMDNDSLRRGRKTTHIEFDEATALLVGDALLSDSFSLIGHDAQIGAEAKVNMITLLSAAIGSSGMVLGQSLDMDWTGKSGYSKDTLDRIHSLKTGRLIATACELGAIAGGAEADTAARFGRFGEKLGLAFQVIDDLLDASGNHGKTSGKDLDQNKLTYLKILSPKEAKGCADALTEQAFSILEGFGSEAYLLRELCNYLLSRDY